VLIPLIRIYCGFLDAMEVFDLASPGEGTRLLTIPTKKSKDGLRGMPPFTMFAVS
jgi:telomerase Cajal body protein 1